ncbi:MAG: aldehyde ferredoxin oxidoreductase family protein [Candidatus Bathyarchaeia archaeon]
MIVGDPLSRVLYIDLTSRDFWVEEKTELFEKYLGGSGVASNLLLQECPRGVDPLGPENPIIITVGPLCGVFPLASKAVAMFKSPLTGNLGESHAGGRSAVAIRLAGYGAIVVKGASNIPVYLSIQGERVYFRDASAIWGMGSSYTVGRVIREREPGSGLRSIMRIGRAGERLVSYACVITETYRHFGRLGLGAVFGSKKLKAIMIAGDRRLKVKDPKSYREAYREIFESVTKSPSMKKYHELGTSMNVNILNESKSLPTRNLRETSFEGGEAISGENFAANYLGRRVACSHCPVSCIHLAALREPYTSDPYFYKTSMISYDYELIYALGSMLEVSDPRSLLRLLDEVEIQGLDAISTGVTLAWATEAQERGLVSENEVGLRLTWGKVENYLEAIRMIVKQPNDFYKALARGVEYASTIYGGKDFALAYGGNEMPGYHTGPACHLGFITGARHSHLDSAGYSIDQRTYTSKTKQSIEETVNQLFDEECWRQILSSLVICYFARGNYTPEFVAKALTVLDYNLDQQELRRLGAEILRVKNRFKFREGFEYENLRIPKRILEVETPHGRLDEDQLRRGIKLYYSKILE